MVNRKNKILIMLGIISVILILLFVFIGVNDRNFNYFMSRRIPKIAAIVLTGVAIAVSSTIFQTVTNNRILTPSALGLDSLYLLVQTLIVFLFSSSNIFVVNKNANFILSVMLMLLFSGLLFKFIFSKENYNIIMLLLIGMVFGTLFQSISSFMQMVLDPNEFLLVQDRMFASFDKVNTKILYLSSIVLVIIITYVYRKSNILDVVSLGKEQAINLGINHRKVMKTILFFVSILVSLATALVGPITFLGILSVNLSREILKTYEHKYLLVGSGLIAVIALVGGQLLVERILNFSTPISVIINFIGGIYFIYLLLKENLA
ncbi:MAG: iron chelate uptake ABC transporter family permease subunit [Tissierellia bacterium]|nr:iron chelate uptake ABC transporter family permease subunit [Tissierellia bacterium]